MVSAAPALWSEDRQTSKLMPLQSQNRQALQAPTLDTVQRKEVETKQNIPNEAKENKAEFLLRLTRSSGTERRIHCTIER